MQIPIFPLQTVLVPGGYLPLQIFEPRYLDMVRDCVRDDAVFGVCLVLDRATEAAPAKHARVGTLAQIRDWHTMDNGLLGITTVGTQRFSIVKSRMRDNGLMMAGVSLIADAPEIRVPDAYLLLSDFVDRFMDKLADNYPGYDRSLLDDASWVGFRLTELLPLKNLERQGLMELNDPVQRLQLLLEMLPRFQ